MTLGATVLGVTIDGYAVEGGYDVEGAPHTSFSVAQSLGMIRSSLRTPGTFEHLDQLVGRAFDLGCGELRLTMEWARLEPRPGTRDLDALATYERALHRARAIGMSVTVVLCDAAWPSWLGREPWLSSWAPEHFASHAGWLAERLAEDVRAMVTFRSPNRAATDGWRTGRRPPHRRGASADATSALDGMLVAHVLAVESIAKVAPTIRSAVLFEADASYSGEGLWRDLAAGIVDPVLLGARRDHYERTVPQTARRGPRAAVGRGDIAGLRSLRRWPDAPPSEWWLASDDLALLIAALDHAAGAVRAVELGAGARGWATQLASAMPLLARTPVLHLHGLVSSTGPLDAPVGLLDVDQHNGRWTLDGPSGAIEDALGRLRS